MCNAVGLNIVILLTLFVCCSAQMHAVCTSLDDSPIYRQHDVNNWVENTIKYDRLAKYESGLYFIFSFKLAYFVISFMFLKFAFENKPANTNLFY